MKLYELKKGTVCTIEDNKCTFLGIDGMYGHWDVHKMYGRWDISGEFCIYGIAGSTLEEQGITINS